MLENSAIDAALSEALGESSDSTEAAESETSAGDSSEIATEDGSETEAIGEADGESLEQDSEEEQDETENETEEEGEDTSDESESTDEPSFEVDGEKVSLSQVKAWRDAEKNYQATHSKRQQKLADTQKQADQKYQQLDQGLQFLENQLKGPLAQFDSVNWQELQANDPAKYQELQGQYKVALQGFQQVEEARKKLKGQAEEQRKADHQRKAKEAVETLQEMHSDWSNELYHSVLKYAVEKGVPQDEIANETRPWVISALLNQMKAEQAQVKPKPKPQTVKRTIKQKAAGKPRTVAQKRADAIKRDRTLAAKGDRAAQNRLTAHAVNSEIDRILGN
ncbi:hypothetical protein [Microbulbifer sp. THAF38]|uniref:hypothetical protein n=1 Tax=Microbulbifer sp. THAF38 TaxID=2587856 RepID=UPI0012684F4F|nr:hypothetical protein [Microbulbifer sp. THAF38]QFT55582.1 hypothetical protein FIU95_13590 [Microbulbifer sp. THAF38]